VGVERAEVGGEELGYEIDPLLREVGQRLGVGVGVEG
jgi:hypothetical protein